MEQQRLTVFVLILALNAFVHYDVAFAGVKGGGYSPDKPGVCPLPKGVGACHHYCTCDNDCYGKEKCCSNGCGHQCVAPTIVKPGSCPIYGDSTCYVHCYHDGECPGHEKCCNTCCTDCTSQWKGSQYQNQNQYRG